VGVARTPSIGFGTTVLPSPHALSLSDEHDRRKNLLLGAG
jgi:hypothetical protein